MSQRDKMSQYRKGAARTGRKYVTDRQNVTNQVNNGGHDVISENTSTLRQGWT
jgi:hypothetical protein